MFSLCFSLHQFRGIFQPKTGRPKLTVQIPFEIILKLPDNHFQVYIILIILKYSYSIL